MTPVNFDKRTSWPRAKRALEKSRDQRSKTLIGDMGGDSAFFSASGTQLDRNGRGKKSKSGP